MKTITSVEAQNNFWALMDWAMRAPITITKHGKPRVIVVSYEDYTELQEVSREEVPDTVYKAYQKSLTSESNSRTNI